MTTRYSVEMPITREQLNMITTTINQEARVGEVKAIQLMVETDHPGDWYLSYERDGSPYKCVVSPNGFRTTNLEAYKKRRRK